MKPSGSPTRGRRRRDPAEGGRRGAAGTRRRSGRNAGRDSPGEVRPIQRRPTPRWRRPGSRRASAPGLGLRRSGSIRRRSPCRRGRRIRDGRPSGLAPGALPWFRLLVKAARDPKTTDGEFTALLIRAQRNLPDELAPLINTEALARAMEANMGAALVNGAVQGWIRRTKTEASK